MKCNVALAGTCLAFLVGALVWVLPPYLLGRVTESPSESAWPLVGNALEQATPVWGVAGTVLLGLIYGFFVPKYWYLLPLATSWIMFLNMFLDMAQYPTSHNLFPFEVMIYAVCNLPAAAAAGLASWMGRRYQSRKTSEVTP